MKKGVFVILSGPSGVGKDTIIDRLVKDNIGIYSISMTTRNRIYTEINGKDYFFTSNDIFEDNIKNNNFLEYAKYNNNYYGTLKNFVFNNINNGTNVLAILEVQGAMKVKEAFPEVILIFIMPPKFEDLEYRLRKRNTDSDEDIIKRLNTAKKEIEYRDKYDYIVVNDDIDKCVNEIKCIIKKEGN